MSYSFGQNYKIKIFQHFHIYTYILNIKYAVFTYLLSLRKIWIAKFQVSVKIKLIIVFPDITQ